MSFWRDVERQEEELAYFSQEHQTALAIARQIKEGYQEEEEERSIGNQGKRAKVVEYFDTVWENHQKSEEKRIFSLAEKRVSSATNRLPELRKQHGKLNILIEQLRQAKSVQLENFILRVGQALEDHVRRHEQFFNYLKGQNQNSKKNFT